MSSEENNVSSANDVHGLDGLTFVHHDTNHSESSSTNAQQATTTTSATATTSLSNMNYFAFMKYSGMEKLWYSFVFETYHDFYNHHNKSWIHAFYNTGLVQMICLILQHLQFLSLVLLPTLMWSKTTKRVFSVFSVIRTWHLEPLFNGFAYFLGTESDLIDNDYNWSSGTPYGAVLNYYCPVLTSLLLSTSLVALFVTLFGMHVLNQKREGFYQHQFIRKLRTVCLYLFHFMLQLLPALYIPILSSLFLTTNCGIHYLQAIDGLETNTTDVCRSNLLLQLTSVVAFLLFIPTFFICALSFFEWRPDQPNMCGKSHARYDVLIYLGLLCSVFLTSYLEKWIIVVMLFEFIIVLFMVMLHVFTLAHYKRIINLMITSFLFTLLFATVISILIGTFMTFTQTFHYSQDNYPGLILFACCFLAIMAGAILTFLRYHVIAILVNDPGALLFWNNLFQQRHIASNEIIVPRSAFEVELATRSLSRVANASFTPSRNSDGMDQWLEVDRVEEMFRNAMDSIHHSSPFVYISFATFKLHLDPPQRTEQENNEEGEDSTDTDPHLNPGNWATCKHLLNVLMTTQINQSKFVQFLSWFIDLRMTFYIRYSYWTRNHIEEALEHLRRMRLELSSRQNSVQSPIAADPTPDNQPTVITEATHNDSTDPHLIPI